MQNKAVHVRSDAHAVRTNGTGRKRRRRARRRPRPRQIAEGSAQDDMTVGLQVCLLDLPDEMLAAVVWWALQEPDTAKTVASLRGCCARLDAVCRTPLFQTSDVDPRLVPFACCDADEYDPTSTVSGDGRLISAAGLARAPRLRRQFVQTCVRYAIYSLMVTKPGTCVSNRGLDLVSFSSFARQRSPFPLLIHALTRSIHAPDHIEVCEYDDGCTKVCVEDRDAPKVFGAKPADLDDRTRGVINSTLAAAAICALSSAKAPPHERAIVADSVDLFEAYPDMVGRLCSTRPGFSCQAGHTRYLTRQATLDISSIVYPKQWDAICHRARRSPKPLTDFSFLSDE
ncbi:hypothetical protein pqer_cds_771 [Pandoravirus quercus]|uniref:Uncharacterized protein n=1 Tax=Pandoravirus quercus TaxID=2107709 RepID=A0A2U7U9S6_9VIRU|nr:hypothetical protein pqer_cds_771 [Pandoravirus quercus]AVK75193.1 hypothetical protein pqer_cds_771 [Pandoravirus quercus]